MPALHWLSWDGCDGTARRGHGLLLLRQLGECAGAGGRAGVEGGEGLFHGLQLWLLLVVGGLLLLMIICRLRLLLLLTVVWILVAVGILLACLVGMGGVGRHDSKRGSSAHGEGALEAQNVG